MNLINGADEMKRLLSLIMTLMIALCSSAPFVYANEGKYTSGSGYNAYEGYATREQAVSCFIKAVGIDRFRSDRKILDKFSDKSKVSYPYIEEMSAAVYSGLINGYEDGTLRPQEPIKRIEALVILSRALSHTDLSARYDTSFSDTPKWASKQVNRLAAAGIIQGYGDGRLGADDFLTLEQVNMICGRIGHFTGPTGDFYTYVNSEWLNSTELSSGESVVSDINKLSQDTNRRIGDIIFSLYRKHYNDGKKFDRDSDEFRIISVYSAAANQGYRDKIGFEPIKKYISDIDGAKTAEELLTVMAELEKCGFTTLLPLGLDTNIYDSSSYTLSLSHSYTGIGSAMWESDSADKYEQYYIDYIEALLTLIGDSDPSNSAEKAAGVCKKLSAAVSGGKVSIDTETTVYSVNDFERLVSEINITKYLKALGFEKAKTIMVYNKKYPQAVSEYLTDKSLGEAKAYLKASLLDSTSAYLTTASFNARQDYYNKLYGTKSNFIPSDYAVGAVQSFMGWELGRLYVNMYLPEYIKSSVEDMTQKIINEYEKLINSCTRMTPQTRLNAVKKLKAITVNAAFPDDFDRYIDKSYSIRPIEEGGSLVEYMTESSKSYHSFCEDVINKGSKATSKGWTIYPQTVNAMYDPTSNSITIPAAILQQPYYDSTASFEENLGGIGTVIAHEISHAFDSLGSQFDENGNVKNWWSDSDRTAFESLCRQTADEYSDISVDGVKVNGDLTLDENLADLAGMSCILGLVGKDNPNLESLFRSYARLWRTKMTDDYARLSRISDVHSPPKVRVNRVLSNFDIFLNFYDVKEGDGMFVPADKRINFWK